MKLDFENEYGYGYGKYEKIYRKILKRICEELHVQEKDIVEVDLIDNPTIHEINRDYRHVDRPTDVISFAFDDKVEGETPIYGNVPHLLGQIVISVDRAKEQANEYGHSLHRELCFLFVHGMLHLLGYDHQTKEEEQVMFSLQDIILSKEGIVC